MKKKLLGIITMFAVFAVIALSLCACDLFAKKKDSADGVYYKYSDGEYDKTDWIKLEGSKWSDSVAKMQAAFQEGSAIFTSIRSFYT